MRGGSVEAGEVEAAEASVEVAEASKEEVEGCPRMWSRGVLTHYWKVHGNFRGSFHRLNLRLSCFNSNKKASMEAHGNTFRASFH